MVKDIKEQDTMGLLSKGEAFIGPVLLWVSLSGFWIIIPYIYIFKSFEFIPSRKTLFCLLKFILALVFIFLTFSL